MSGCGTTTTFTNALLKGAQREVVFLGTSQRCTSKIKTKTLSLLVVFT